MSGVWVQSPEAQPLGPNAQALQLAPICPAQVFLTFREQTSQGGGKNRSCGVRTSRYVWGCSQYPPRSCLFLKLISDCGVKCYDLYLRYLSANGWIGVPLSEYPPPPWISSRKVPSHWCLCGNYFFLSLLYQSFSLMCMGLSWGSCQNANSDSLSLRRGPKLCIFNKLPEDAGTSGQWTHLE